jgi:DNA-binding response OmpR family regulator
MPHAFEPSAAVPGHILAVDDKPDNLRVLALELRGHPFVLTIAASAEEALAYCARQRFEGVLLDVSLPGMDGIEVCRRIRGGTLNARTPIIFLSALKVGDEWVAKGLGAGGLDYLTKPYAFQELLAKLKLMVRLCRQEMALLDEARQRALLEVAGGATHELAQPLSSARLLADILVEGGGTIPAAQAQALRESLDSACVILRKLQDLDGYATKPYARGHILDLGEASPEADTAAFPIPQEETPADPAEIA